MEITATIKYLRIAPRKVRLVSGLVKGLDASIALSQLSHWTKRPTKPIIKLINSAMSNAHHNHGLAKDNLFIKDIIVNEGRKIKRFKPKGFGSASPIEKKTAHVTVILSERVPGLKAEKSEAPKEEVISAERTEKKTDKKKPEIKSDAKKSFGGIKSVRRLFQRKTG